MTVATTTPTSNSRWASCRIRLTGRHLNRPMEGPAVTSGASGRATSPEGDFPKVFTIGTLELSHFRHFDFSSFNS